MRRLVTLGYSLLGMLIWGLPLLASRHTWNSGWLLLTASVLVLFLFIWLLMRLGTKSLSWLLVLIFCLQAQWGIGQVIVGADLNLQMAGEPLLAADVDGVAKFLVGDEKMLRAYGPYRHPNVLGAVLIAGCTLLVLGSRGLRIDMSDIFIFTTATVLILGVLLTFSRTAYLGGLILALMSLISVTHLRRRLLMLILIVLAALVPLILWRMVDRDDVAVQERFLGYSWAFHILNEQPIWSGSGKQYEVALSEYLSRQGTLAEAWQIDYVHSVPLLMMVRLGTGPALLLITLVIFALIRGFGWRSFVWLLIFVPALAFDHFLVTQVESTLIVGLSATLIPRLLV